MRNPTTRLRRLVERAAASALLACGGGGENPAEPSSIDVALSSSAVSVAQGATSVPVTVTVVRTNFSGDVQLTVENAAANVTHSFTTATLAAGQTQSTLSVSVGAAAVTGTANLTVRARGASVADKTAPLALTVTPGSGYSLSTPAPMTLQPGQSGTASLTLTRTGFAGAVTLSVEGLPTGATGAFSPNPVTTDASTLTLSTGTTAAAGTYTVTVRGTAAGLADRVATFTLTIAVPSYTLSLGTSDASLYQGTTSAATVTVARTNFAGPVTFSASGVPSGATVSLAPTSTTGSVTVATVNTGSAAPGTYPVTIRAAADGMADRTTSLSLTIVAAAPTANVVYNLCASSSPVWVGYQSGSGPWTTLGRSLGGDYHFDVAGVGAFAYVIPLGGDGAPFGYGTGVTYGSAADLNAIGGGSCARGTKSVTGTVAGLTVADNASGVAIGLAGANVAATPGTFTISGILDGPHDLAATRTASSSSGAVTSRMILRRGLDPVNGAVLPVLDFGSAEAFTPSTQTLTVGGPGSSDIIAGASLLTATGTSALLSWAPVLGGTVAARSVPDANVAPGDVHSLFADALDDASERAVYSYFQQAASRTLTLPPVLLTPSLSLITTSPVTRFLTFMPYQPAYGLLVQTEYDQHGVETASNDRLVNVVVGRGYYPAVPAQWVAIVPDLTGNAAYDAAWGLKSATTDVYIEVDGGSPLGSPSAEGYTATFAATGGTISVGGSGTAITSRLRAPRRPRAPSVQRERPRPPSRPPPPPP